MRFRSLGQKDPQDVGMAPYSSTLAWRIPWAEEPGGLQSIVSQSQIQLKQFSTQAWDWQEFKGAVSHLLLTILIDSFHWNMIYTMHRHQDLLFTKFISYI